MCKETFKNEKYLDNVYLILKKIYLLHFRLRGE
jgi:hypothetical protein